MSIVYNKFNRKKPIFLDTCLISRKWLNGCTDDVLELNKVN